MDEVTPVAHWILNRIRAEPKYRWLIDHAHDENTLIELGQYFHERLQAELAKEPDNRREALTNVINRILYRS